MKFYRSGLLLSKLIHLSFGGNLDNVPVSVAQTITAKTYNLTMFQDATSSPLETVPASVSTIDETVFRENTFHSQDTVTNASQSITLETHRPHSFPIPILERYDINKQIGKGGNGNNISGSST